MVKKIEEIRHESIGIVDLFSRVSWGKLILLLIFTAINSFVSLTFVAVTTFASELTNDSNLQDIIFFCLKGIALYLIIYGAMYFTELLINVILKEVTLSLIDDMVKSYYHQYSGTEDEIISVITQDIRMLREEYFQPILTLPTYILRSAIPIIYLLSQNLLVGILFTIGAILMLLPQYIGKRKIVTLGKLFSTTREKSLSLLVDVIKGKSMIQSNEADGFFLGKIHSDFSKTEDSERRLKTFQAFIFCLTSPIKGIADVIPFAAGIYLMRFNTTISLVLLMAMLVTAGNLKNQFQQVIYLMGYISGTQEVRDKVGKIFSTSSVPNSLTQKRNLLYNFDYLEIKNVAKNYGEKVIFHSFSLAIPNGSKVLLTGASGIGKSTLFRMMMGQETTDSGGFYLVKGEERFPLQGQAAIVQQSPYFLNGTIRENLCLGEDFAEARLNDILSRVQLLDQLGKNALDITIEKNGANISGGQKMKLELGRALLRNKPILLVDELSSSLDKETSDEIRKIILSSDKTVIEITHHFSDTHDYDLLMQIDNKRINIKEGNSYARGC